MPRLAQILLGWFLFGSTLIWFEVGLYKLPGDEVNASFFGALAGVASAEAWALSVLGNHSWNQVLNIYTALFAALGVGYLTPVNVVCGSTLHLLFLCP